MSFAYSSDFYRAETLSTYAAKAVSIIGRNFPQKDVFLLSGGSSGCAFGTAILLQAHRIGVPIKGHLCLYTKEISLSRHRAQSDGRPRSHLSGWDCLYNYSYEYRRTPRGRKWKNVIVIFVDDLIDKGTTFESLRTQFKEYCEDSGYDIKVNAAILCDKSTGGNARYIIENTGVRIFFTDSD